MRKLNARLHELPGFNVGINQPISDMVFDLIGGAHSALVIRVVGDDFAEDRRIANEIVDILRNTRGTAEASIFQEPPLPQIVIETDRAAAARYGINISDITNLIQTGVGGARGHAGLCRRPHLRRERAFPFELPLRSGSSRKPDL